MTRQPVRRNPYLTPAMERVLKTLAADEDNVDLVTEGGVAYAGNERTSIATVNRLLRLCLVRADRFHDHGDFQRYEINEDGRGCVNDPDYVPQFVVEMRKRAKVAARRAR